MFVTGLEGNYQKYKNTNKIFLIYPYLSRKLDQTFMTNTITSTPYVRKEYEDHVKNIENQQDYTHGDVYLIINFVYFI